MSVCVLAASACRFYVLIFIADIKPHWNFKKEIEHKLFRRQFVCTCCINYWEGNLYAMGTIEKAVRRERTLLRRQFLCTCGIKSIIHLLQCKQLKLLSSAVYCCHLLVSATHCHLISNNQYIPMERWAFSAFCVVPLVTADTKTYLTREEPFKYKDTLMILSGIVDAKDSLCSSNSNKLTFTYVKKPLDRFWETQYKTLLFYVYCCLHISFT
jgi:hypothetical protein